MVSLTKEEILDRISFDKISFQAFASPSRLLERADRIPELKQRVFMADVREYEEEGKLVIEGLEKEQLNDDGLDLTIGNVIYGTEIMLGSRVSVRDLEELVSCGNAKKFQLEDGEPRILWADERGRFKYYAPSKEKILLPSDLEMVCDSKSSIGRIGTLCSDVTHEFSLRTLPSQVISVVQPYIFPIVVHANKSKLLQAMFRVKKSSHMAREEIAKIYGKEIKSQFNGNEIEFDKAVEEDKLVLHYSTARMLVSKALALIPEPIDVDKTEWYNVEEYFDEKSGNNELLLKGRKLYLLGSQEEIYFGNVCGRLSREYKGHLAGSLGHFAGFIHRGWFGGITFEYRGDDDRIVKEGELAGAIELDVLLGTAAGKEAKGSYLGQKPPQAPKMFKRKIENKE